jgi:hypothetical protein
MMSTILFLQLLIRIAVFVGLAPDPIRLQPQSLPFTPKEFYIANVTDLRSDKGPIARLALVYGQPPQPVDLDGGILYSFRAFINQSLKQNKSLRPIAMRINKCRVTEKAVGNRVSGEFVYDVAFDLISKDDYGIETGTRLTEYSGSATYTRPLNQITVIEPTIRQAITASLRSLNDYMNRESKQNEKLASGIRVVFTDDTRITTDDTVHYNPERLLTWDDFRAEPRRTSHYAAEVFTSFAYEGKSSVKDGVITLNLNVKSYVLKKSSWARADAKNTYALNHEQRHFDITKLIAERFKRAIHPDSLTVEDYNSLIQYKFIESFREMNRMQKQYDGETNHSLNQAAQEQWNQKIDAELRSFGLKK